MDPTSLSYSDSHFVVWCLLSVCRIRLLTRHYSESLGASNPAVEPRANSDHLYDLSEAKPAGSSRIVVLSILAFTKYCSIGWHVSHRELVVGIRYSGRVRWWLSGSRCLAQHGYAEYGETMAPIKIPSYFQNKCTFRWATVIFALMPLSNLRKSASMPSLKMMPRWGMREMISSVSLALMRP